MKLIGGYGSLSRKITGEVSGAAAAIRDENKARPSPLN
jgi:hypothetical protein